MTRDQDHSERLTRLEERVAYQDRLVDELNRIVTEQRLRFDDLAERMREIARQLAQLAGSDRGPEKPPHY